MGFRGALLGTLLLLAVLMAVMTWAAREDEGARARRARVITREPRPPSPEWAGSGVCGECHVDLFERWSRSNHGRSTRLFQPEYPARPFEGEYFTARGIEMRVGPGPVMECDGPGGDLGRYEVEWVLGVRRIQMFTTRLPGGRIQTLPVFLEVSGKEWFDYAHFIFGGPSKFEIPPDSPNVWYGPLRNFNSRCGSCHMTNFETGYDPDSGTYASTWSELVIGCESCHGAGGKHVDKWRNLTDEPEPLVNLARLPVSLANQNCGFCHSESIVVKPGFKPGDNLFRFNEVNGIEDAVHAQPDGRAAGLFHNLIPIMESKCGELSCTECHDAHGGGIPGDLYRELEWDGLCARCHGEILTDIEAHTFHRGESPGSRCVNCHLPPITIEAGHGRVRDHTISTPSPRNSRNHGLPNACVDCHLAEAPGWVGEWFEKWWPGAEQRNHRVELCDAMAAVREKQPDAKAKMLPWLENGNPVYRAAAAWSLAGFRDVDLRPLLDDDHPLVRRGAIAGVARHQPEALIPMLSHPNVVLRGAAAEALAKRGEAKPFDYMTSHPELREQVLAVLETLVRLRPDRSQPHYLSGVLHELSGRPERARRSYERYLRLNPFDARVRAHLKRMP